MKPSHTRNCFLDGPVGIARYERQRYNQFEKLVERQMSYFWTPQEIDIYRDSSDFKQLNEIEQHIFVSNLKRQIVLDSVQGREPSLALLPICSLPELENWIQTWAFFETIHSRSYTHIIRNIFSNPSKVFDEIMDVPEIVSCNDQITDYYAALERHNQEYLLSGRRDAAFMMDMKKALWLALVSVNVLEGIRFYVSFACSWAFAEQKTMEGNAKIIKLIARDENLHLAGTQHLIKILPKEDPDFERIREETYAECQNMFYQAAQSEKEWADYLFKDGSMLGLNAGMLKAYVDWLTERRMKSAGYEYVGAKRKDNPLPWTQKWIAGENVQVAPQEVELSSYTVGQIDKNINKTTFEGFKL